MCFGRVGLVLNSVFCVVLYPIVPYAFNSSKLFRFCALVSNLVSISCLGFVVVVPYRLISIATKDLCLISKLSRICALSSCVNNFALCVRLLCVLLFRFCAVLCSVHKSSMSINTVSIGLVAFVQRVRYM